MKLTPKQLGIVGAMRAIKKAYEYPEQELDSTQRLGVAQKRGMRKELALIFNRLGNRLPDGIEWSPLPVDIKE